MNSKETAENIGCLAIIGLVLLVYAVLPPSPPIPLIPPDVFFFDSPETHYAFLNFLKQLAFALGVVALFPFFFVVIVSVLLLPFYLVYKLFGYDFEDKSNE